MGHCLWTGIVDEEKAPHVARGAAVGRRCSAAGACARCRRTTAGYNPISYHCGSVWPHDNAICAAGLMRYGFVDEAHQVMRGLVDASPWFGDLLPELFSGIDAATLSFPVSYPTSCSPQAWAAASPLLFLRTLLRFEPDIRNSKLHLAPAVPDWIGTLRLDNIPLMGGHLAVEVDGRGRARAAGARGPHDRVGSRGSPTPLERRSDRRRPSSEGEVAVGVGPPARRAACPRRRAPRSTCSRVNFALTSVRISSPAANGTSSSSARTCTVCASSERRRISIRALSVSNTATCSKRVDVEVGVELAVHDREHVLVELGGDALRVVVRGFEAVDVLDEIEAEQQVVVGAEALRDLEQELGANAAAAGCRSCRRGTRPAGDRRRESCRDDARSRRPPRARRPTGTRGSPPRPRRATSARSRRRARSA